MKPPALADWALRVLCRGEAVQDAIGDLHEEFSRFQLGELGPFRSRLWYWSQALGVLIRYGRFPLSRRGIETRLQAIPTRASSPAGSGIAMDLRHSFRRVLASPGISLVTVTSLALGIGVTSSVLSAVKGVLLEPLPYSEPGDLVIVGGTIPGVGSGALVASPPEYREFRERGRSLAALAASWTGDSNLTGGDTPVRVATSATTPDFFSVLGVRPAIGRGFRPGDAEGWMGSVALISHEAWVRHFDRDPEALGRELQLDGDPYSIIGVMPRDFEHPADVGASPVEVWVPIDLSEGTPIDLRGARQFTLVGRLMEGVSLEESRRELGRLGEAQEDANPGYYPPDGGWSVDVVPLLHQTVVGAENTLFLLLGSVGLLFAAILSNVANLQLNRGLARSTDFAVRSAIGGTRLRLVGQFFTENSVLGLLGCAGGIGLAFAGTHALRGLVSQEFPRFRNIETDGTVIVLAVALSLFSVLLFAVVPAMHLSRAQPSAILGGGFGGPGPRGARMRNRLVVAQVAISLVLLVGAGLLFKSFHALSHSELGFDPKGVLSLATWLPVPKDQSAGEYVPVENRSAFLAHTLEAMEQLPGVTAAALTSLLPLRGRSGTPLWPAEDPAVDSVGLTAEYRVVSDAYFSAMGIELLQGRPFGADDGYGGPPVAIVSRALANQLYPGQDPLGKVLRLGRSGEKGSTVIGVVADVPAEGGTRIAAGTVYRPFRQGVGNEVTFVLKTLGRPEALAEAAVAALQRGDPDLPAFAVASMERVVAGAHRQHRMLLVLFCFFGISTLGLSALGIFGVVSFAVTRRTREIGVRMALGGGSRQVIRLLLGEGLHLGLSGVGLGLLGAVGLSRFLEASLHEVGPLDPWVYAASAGFLLLLVTISSLIPALGVTKVDHVSAIKAA